MVTKWHLSLNKTLPSYSYEFKSPVRYCGTADSFFFFFLLAERKTQESDTDNVSDVTGKKRTEMDVFPDTQAPVFFFLFPDYT